NYCGDFSISNLKNGKSQTPDRRGNSPMEGAGGGMAWAASVASLAGPRRPQTRLLVHVASPVAGAVQLAHGGLELQLAEAPAIGAGPGRGGFASGHGGLRRQPEIVRAAGRAQALQLNPGGGHQQLDADSVMTQQQDGGFLSDGFDEGRPLALVRHDAVEIVKSDFVHDGQGLRAQRQQAAAAVGHGQGFVRVQVHNGPDVRPGRVNGRVQHPAGLIDAEDGAATIDNIAGQVDLHQAAGGDLTVLQAERVDEEVLAGALHAGLRPAVQVNQAIDGGQLTAEQPLLGLAAASPPRRSLTGSTEVVAAATLDEADGARSSRRNASELSINETRFRCSMSVRSSLISAGRMSWRWYSGSSGSMESMNLASPLAAPALPAAEGAFDDLIAAAAAAEAAAELLFFGIGFPVAKSGADVVYKCMVRYGQRSRNPSNSRHRKIKRKTFTYMGCYMDKAQSRDLLIPGGHGNHMDPTECNEVCKKRMKTKFMGLQDGGNCWCGNKFNKYGKAKDSACNTPCAGNPKEKCGGRYLNSVFETA
uniref:WSC domain-containing protein n=1 Tax=Macrostomum lignano TaxID=282301 RepID=A0A1I8ID34_9PLAT